MAVPAAKPLVVTIEGPFVFRESLATAGAKGEVRFIQNTSRFHDGAKQLSELAI